MFKLLRSSRRRKPEVATGSGVGFLRLTAVFTLCGLLLYTLSQTPVPGCPLPVSSFSQPVPGFQFSISSSPFNVPCFSSPFLVRYFPFVVTLATASRSLPLSQGPSSSHPLHSWGVGGGVYRLECLVKCTICILDV